MDHFTSTGKISLLSRRVFDPRSNRAKGIALNSNGPDAALLDNPRHSFSLHDFGVVIGKSQIRPGRRAQGPFKRNHRISQIVIPADRNVIANIFLRISDIAAKHRLTGCCVERYHLRSWRVAAGFEQLQSRIKLHIAFDQFDAIFLL